MGISIGERVEQLLFGSGLTVENYYIERTPVSEVICYKNREGRRFDLLVDDDALGTLAKRRLLELGVKVDSIGVEGVSSDASAKP
ncbi:hypothetical protein JM946_02325 [Steroidobacter sp. S1-65]|uniref:Uncharacterized protein n=1 Tax=Steroidobacter gossypii TaxID=2805490 RepID=A0ABS1WRG0_9GAMM|nr:hypothetical protein [Steroidobacter gossypii]MBM0103557.1 hypothetical protein [Steroidobacter gossypii]